MSSIDTVEYSPKEPRATGKDTEQQTELADQDNEQWRSDLPEKFSGLLDEHFPLFITYDQVWISLSPKHLISPFCE